MDTCTEFAVFTVHSSTRARAVALSYAIFDEMNINGAILSARVLQKNDALNELCWHIEWASEALAKEITAKWPKLNNTLEFQGLVFNNIYYGHFLPTIK